MVRMGEDTRVHHVQGVLRRGGRGHGALGGWLMSSVSRSEYTSAWDLGLGLTSRCSRGEERVVLVPV